MMHLHAVTARDRNAATAITGEMLSRHGWIVDVVLFSNKMTNYQLCTTLDALDGLPEALATEGIHLSDDSLAVLAEAAVRARLAPVEERRAEVYGTLELTFLAEEPDLRREIPSVPG